MEKRSIVTDFSKTERTLVLIDLSPLLHLHHHHRNPNLYITPLLKSTQILLSHLSSLSPSCLSSFKFFFSSSSHFPSTSKLPINLANSLSFDRPSNTLRSLSAALNSLPGTVSPSGSGSELTPPACSRGSNIAGALRQVLRDYAWDYQLEDNDYCSAGEVSCNAVANSGFVRSNLIVVFSPFGDQLTCLSEFVGLDSNDESLVNPEVFCEMFRRIFGNVNCTFTSKDIHLSWVDVKFESGGTEEAFGVDESDVKLGFLEKGVKSLGWGFCSTESIILGSAIVPFGLIYPLIGVLPHRFRARDNSKELVVQLNLQISGVDGNPIECRCCDLSLVDLNLLPANRRDDDDVSQGYKDRGYTFWGRFRDGATKVFIKAVQRYDEMRFEGGVLDIVLVNGFSEKSSKERNLKPRDGEFFPDTVLKKLTLETAGCSQSSTLQPIWPIVLSYLYNEGCCGLVSLTNENGDSCEGFLKPFTAHSAFLFIVDEKQNPQNMFCLQRGINPTSNLMMRAGDGKKKKHGSRFYNDLTWNTFCRMATDQLDVNLDLGGLYIAKERANSKKLKFLKCWMNEMKKSKRDGLSIPDRSKPDVHMLEGREQRLTRPENEPAISSSASAGEDAPTEVSRVLDPAAFDTYSGTSDVFFNNLSERINDALESKGLDLAALTERLVSSAIYWLYQKHEKDGCSSMIADELMTLVLREPKELGKREKLKDPCSVDSDPRTTAVVSEITIQEYELQIFFRMEILRSEISMSIEESVKHRFLKQICVLLEKIQCHHGGFFGDWCLDNYVERTIKNRYSDTLEDTVNKLYKKMDLLPFADEDESANPLLNSEDSSNQSFKDKQENEEDTGENDVAAHNILKADEFFQGIQEEEHACKLIEAQNRRERARRFASFTSWAPDLRRVWAPKQMKPPVSGSSTTQHKVVSQKKRRRVKNFVSVCETPITKNGCEEINSSYGNNSCKPVSSKVLFRD